VGVDFCSKQDYQEEVFSRKEREEHKGFIVGVDFCRKQDYLEDIFSRKERKERKGFIMGVDLCSKQVPGYYFINQIINVEQ